MIMPQILEGDNRKMRISSRLSGNKVLVSLEGKGYDEDYINLSFSLFDEMSRSGLDTDLLEEFVGQMALSEIDNGRLRYYYFKKPEIEMFVDKGDWEWVDKE